MDATARDALQGQFGAAIDMLENAIRACPHELWTAGQQRPEFWYLVYHTLFSLDLYLDDATDGFSPPAPFTLSELDPTGVLPDRAYTKEELLAYLDHGRRNAQARIAALTADTACEECSYGWIRMSRVESLFYNMRHVQHHAAQLNLLLRQLTNSAPPDWVPRSGF
jgi:hypothetical protein